jgi:hypothetical protein
MNERRRNWQIWIGFLLCLLAIPSYLAVFAKFPVTRDVPWVTFLIFAAGLLLLASGIRRAFAQPQEFRGKIAGPIVGVLGLAAAGLFCFGVFYGAKQIPKSAGTPRVGEKAPDFTLADTAGRQVSLGSLLAEPLPNSQTPPKAVLLVFYRGYW